MAGMCRGVLPPVDRLVIMDMLVQYGDGDTQDAVAAAKVLQGLVNRRGTEKLYLFNDATDMTHDIGGKYWCIQSDWLDRAEAFSGIPRETIVRKEGPNGGLHGLMDRYASCLQGLVVWDDTRHNNINMAAFGAAVTIASQQEGLAVSPALLEQIAGWGYDLPVLLDLRSYEFTSDHALLDWCIGQYWEGSNHDIHCVFSLGLDGWAPNDQWGDNWLSHDTFHEGPIDYAVALNGFAFNINISDANDEHVLMKLLRKYPEGRTAVLGWVPSHPFLCGFSEVPTCLNATSYFVIGVNGFSNLSVFAACPRGEAYKSVPKAYDVGPDDVFINFLASDGDALHCVYRGMFASFTKDRDACYGQVPITWTICPVLAEIAPPVYDFFAQNLPLGSDLAIAWADKIYSVWDTGSDSLAETWREYAQISGLHTIWTVNSDEETQRADICHWDSIIVGYHDSRVEPRLSVKEAHTSVFGTWHFGDGTWQEMAEGIRAYAEENPGRPLFLTVVLGASFGEAREFYARALRVKEALSAGDRRYRFVNAGDMASTYRAYLNQKHQ